LGSQLTLTKSASPSERQPGPLPSIQALGSVVSSAREWVSDDKIISVAESVVLMPSSVQRGNARGNHAVWLHGERDFLPFGKAGGRSPLRGSPAVSLFEGIGDGTGEVGQSQWLGKHGEDRGGSGAGDDLVVESPGDENPGWES
jgi:hypothetical protein